MSSSLFRGQLFWTRRLNQLILCLTLILTGCTKQRVFIEIASSDPKTFAKSVWRIRVTPDNVAIVKINDAFGDPRVLEASGLRRSFEVFFEMVDFFNFQMSSRG